MSLTDKIEAKIRNNPCDVSLEDLIKLMELYGFRAKKTREGYMFYHSALRGKHQIPRVANPHGKGERKVKKSYVLICLEAIDVLLEVLE
jgi:hypothetical protein